MTKKINKNADPHAKRNRINTRVSNAELQEILKRALVYEHGNLSEYARVAMLGYKREKAGAK